jgi:hypothetical protein
MWKKQDSWCDWHRQDFLPDLRMLLKSNRKGWTHEICAAGRQMIPPAFSTTSVSINPFLSEGQDHFFAGRCLSATLC